MDLSLSATTLVILLFFVVLYLSVVYLFGPKYDDREPPVVPHFIPYVGHILGLICYGQNYFETLRFADIHQSNSLCRS